MSRLKRKPSPPPCHDLPMFRFMIMFTLFFTMGKAYTSDIFKMWGMTWLPHCPRCLIWEMPPPGAFYPTHSIGAYAPSIKIQTLECSSTCLDLETWNTSLSYSMRAYLPSIIYGRNGTIFCGGCAMHEE
jgi:hypothetical protein